MSSFRRPELTEGAALQLAASLYGVTDANLRPLPSERDQNFLLQAPDGRRYVLKVANGAESWDVLDLQNRTLEHLLSCGLSLAVPQLVPTSSGQEIGSTGLAAGRPSPPTETAGDTEFFTRLLTWVPGVPFARVKPHSPELLRSLGHRLGELDRVLSDFAHPAANRTLSWDLNAADAFILDNVALVADPSRRALIERFLDRFEAFAAPRLSELRTGIIHNDGNDYNVLVDSPLTAGRVDSPREVSGIVDFGDMVHSWIVAEPAVACAYAMLGKVDPVGAATHVLRGYHEANPLNEPEIDVLYELARLRLALSAVTESFQRRREPEIEYLSISSEQVWSLLGQLDGLEPQLARYRLRDACGLEPCPAGRRLAEWLDSGAVGAGLVLEAAMEPAVILDLSVDGPDAADPARPDEADDWTRRVFRRIEDEGAAVGIGRYDEVRACYTSAAFASKADERTEMRTVHLGIDLFVPPGTPVLAPLDGVVHACRDNAQRLDYGPTVILRHEVVGAGISFFTLYGHLSPETLETVEEGARVERGERIGWVGDRPRNGDWPPHLHIQLIADLLGEHGTFPGVAAPGQRDVWRSLCPNPGQLLHLPDSATAPPAPDRAWLLEERAQRLGPSLSVSYSAPLHILRGAGTHLYDADGQPHLDCVNNVAHVGHNHPSVVRAGQAQMAVLNTNTRYLHEALLHYAERLAGTLPDPLEVCFFVCSGSEANELALRLARTHTGGTDVVVLEGGYHGNTSALVEISAYKFDGPGGAGAPAHVHVAPMPDPYRGLYRSPGPEAVGREGCEAGETNGEKAGEKYAAAVNECVGRASAGGRRPAAFFAEPLLGCGGQIVPPDGFLAAAFEHVRRAGGVCVADEVQIGFGRVGTHFWGFETQGAIPDIVTLGKPIGNGHPLGAVVTTREIAESFDTGMEYFNTFGGNPVSCAIGLAVLDVIEREELQKNAREVGRRLLEGLGQLKATHAVIGDVRGVGLYLGVEFVLDRDTRSPAPLHASHAVERMRERGILLSTDGPDHNVIKIKPPLVFSQADANRLLETLDSVLSEDAFRLE
jgi:4-aminobutyrate aminotransferase-like enzyme/Ser/Thr protein kinase RdoA (MazF antagonist)